jgi:hypothetical protein
VLRGYITTSPHHQKNGMMFLRRIS